MQYIVVDKELTTAAGPFEYKSEARHYAENHIVPRDKLAIIAMFEPIGKQRLKATIQE